MECAGPDEKVLTKVIPRFVIFGDGAEKSEQAPFGIGLPEFFDAIDS
jgi:hypothetical protein